MTNFWLAQFNDAQESLAALGMPAEVSHELLIKAREGCAREDAAFKAQAARVGGRVVAIVYAYADGRIAVRPPSAPPPPPAFVMAAREYRRDVVTRLEEWEQAVTYAHGEAAAAKPLLGVARLLEAGDRLAVALAATIGVDTGNGSSASGAG